MKLGYVTLQGRGRTDALIAQATELLAAEGLRLCGTVQTNTTRPGRAKCDMDLRILPDGPVIRISEDRGDLARGCRLDSGALEQTVQQVEQRLDGADLLIVNKFGKRETEGRGLSALIAEALDRGIPVLVGVNALNLPAFQEFSGGLAQALPPDPAGIVHWFKAH
ncbi:DUF2478 domain-containing protein [Pontitalea aquivivens]|uniref:DUF2478 domain-containing protein n=1 Tax=Pontitalea aquivivens TaxID=3388663 RepID=UPI003970C29A